MTLIAIDRVVVRSFLLREKGGEREEEDERRNLLSPASSMHMKWKWTGD